MPESFVGRLDTSNAAAWAKTWVDQLEKVLRDGLPDVYHGSWYDWLADAVAGNLPWSEPLNTQVWQAVWADPRFEALRTQLAERLGQPALWAGGPTHGQD